LLLLQRHDGLDGFCEQNKSDKLHSHSSITGAAVTARPMEFAMTDVKFNNALIVGAGSGLSASLARALAKDGIKVALAARSTGDLDALAKETGAKVFACDASQRGEVDKLFAASMPRPVRRHRDLHASFRTRGPFVDLARRTSRRRSHRTSIERGEQLVDLAALAGVAGKYLRAGFLRQCVEIAVERAGRARP